MPDVSEIIRTAAAQYGLDPNTMLRIAQTESGLNPNTANPKSSARGLYQFMTAPGGSWSEYGRGGNPLDPVANADAGMRYTRDNISHLRNALGRDPTPGEIYLAHQQGRAGAAALLKDPNQPAVNAIGGFYKNPATARDAIVLNGGRDGMTAGEFANKWVSRFDGGSAPAPPAPVAVAQSAPQMRQPMQRAESPLSDVLMTFAQQMQKQAKPANAPRQLVYG